MLIYVFPRDENYEDAKHINRFLDEIYTDDIYITSKYA